MKTNCQLIAMLIVLSIGITQAQIKVSDNQRFLATAEGKPFFWLGDTAWELFHRLTREEIEEYLNIRSGQGFNLVQAVALAEWNGLRGPNRYGDYPLNNEDPTQLLMMPGNNPDNAYEYDYWDHVEFTIKKAAEKGIYIGMVPTWGDKVAHLWGDGPIIFNEKNAKVFGALIAARFEKHANIVWILGGDRSAIYKSDKEGSEKEYDDRPIWRAMAKGIESVLGKEAFITYHPSGGENATAKLIHNEPWLDMNAFQSGHGAREATPWKWVTENLSLSPQKPALDLEPCYEDHPVNPWDGKWTRARGYFSAYDVRVRIYRGVFTGTSGVTYGHHQIWQFLNTDVHPAINVGDTLIGWKKATQAEAARQMQHLKKLMLSRPYFSRIADQGIIKSPIGSTYMDWVSATRDENNSFAMIHLPQNQPVKIDLSKISGSKKNIWWYDVRTGKAVPGKSVNGKGTQSFTPPKEGKDWVLVIDDASKNYSSPGQ
jgi:hypothetical protein